MIQLLFLGCGTLVGVKTFIVHETPKHSIYSLITINSWVITMLYVQYGHFLHRWIWVCEGGLANESGYEHKFYLKKSKLKTYKMYFLCFLQFCQVTPRAHCTSFTVLWLMLLQQWWLLAILIVNAHNLCECLLFYAISGIKCWLCAILIMLTTALVSNIHCIILDAY